MIVTVSTDKCSFSVEVPIISSDTKKFEEQLTMIYKDALAYIRDRDLKESEASNENPDHMWARWRAPGRHRGLAARHAHPFPMRGQAPQKLPHRLFKRHLPRPIQQGPEGGAKALSRFFSCRSPGGRRAHSASFPDTRRRPGVDRFGSFPEALT